VELTYFALNAYAEAIREQIALGNLEPALIDVALRAEAVQNDPLAFARIFGSATLDVLCAELGAAVLSEVESKSSVEPIVKGLHALHICTETLSSGGHARVVADLIRVAPEYTHHVVLTNLWSRPQLFTQEFEALGARITVLQEGSMLQKLRELTALLDRFECARVFLMNHHQDAVAVAAVGANSRHERFFIHHCDFLFCLGVYLPGVVHVDLHNMGFQDCRDQHQVKDNVYWPLVCEDDGTLHSNNFFRSDRLITCCCGAEHKFIGRYPIDYFDTIAEMLKGTSGKHIHIGPIQDADKRRLLAKMASYGVEHDRFQHIPHVPNLRAALVELDVDVYMVSFPVGGGRALIEAMAAGVPVLGHRHHHHAVLGSADLLPEASPVWSDVPELLSILRSLKPETLQALSSASRTRFEERHHPRLLAKAVRGEKLMPPARRAQSIEALQVFLFEKFFLTPVPKKSYAATNVSWR